MAALTLNNVTKDPVVPFLLLNTTKQYVLYSKAKLEHYRKNFSAIQKITQKNYRTRKVFTV